ncbi:MAG TPA: NUDIX hydrolase [Bryobacteraceae bacterium]|nr:NUDIX hydrolase [Bryobacteraceae bacterium]
MPRRYPKHPLPGVGAIIFRRNSILLVQRGREPLKGWWSLPGGLIETGEKMEDALKREVREETGLIVRPTRLFEIFERIMHDKKGCAEYHYILHDYLCTVVSGELLAGDDAGSVAWVPHGKLKDLQLTEGTLAVIDKAFHARRQRT